MNLFIDKVKAHGEASRLTVEARALSRQPGHSSGHRYREYGVRSKWKFFYEVYVK